MHSLHINASGPAASLTSGSSLQQNEQALFAGSDFSEFRLVTRVVHHAIAKLSSISSSVSNAIEYAAVVSEAALWRCPALNRLFHNSVNSPWTLSNVLSDLSIISNWEVFVKLSTDYNIRGHPLDFSRQPRVRILSQVNGLALASRIKLPRYCVLVSGYRDTVT